MNRWPFRQGAALGMGAMVLLGIGSLAILNAGASNNLPVGHAAEGMYVFEDDCASCHGFYAEGSAAAPALIGAGRAADVMSRGDLARHIEVPAGSMPDLELSGQDLADAIAYLDQIQAFEGG